MLNIPYSTFFYFISSLYLASLFPFSLLSPLSFSPPPPLLFFFLFSPSPPPPPPITTAPKVLFQDNTVKPFKPKFYIKLDLLKIIRSHLNAKTLFKLILLATSYLYKNSFKYKAEYLFKKIKNINNAKTK